MMPNQGLVAVSATRRRSRTAADACYLVLISFLLFGSAVWHCQSLAADDNTAQRGKRFPRSRAED